VLFSFRVLIVAVVLKLIDSESLIRTSSPWAGTLAGDQLLVIFHEPPLLLFQLTVSACTEQTDAIIRMKPRKSIVTLMIRSVYVKTIDTVTPDFFGRSSQG
jgi:hypothetical protein